MMRNLLLILYICLFILTGCERNHRKQELPEERTEIAPLQSQTNERPVKENHRVNPNINIYIENSGSMNGYINGYTDFKGAIRDLLVLLKYHYDSQNIRIFFVNSAIHPTKTEGDIVNFAKQLNAITFRVGDIRSSNLNGVFKQVLRETNKNNISILISDCIYSISGKETENYLDDAKSLTKDAFLSKYKSTHLELVTTLVKLNSFFDGRYYDKFDRGFNIKQSRPYYLCVIGDNEVMSDFNSKVELENGKIAGFENKYILTSKDYSQQSFYTVLTQTKKNGRFKPDRAFTTMKAVKGIEGAKVNGRENGAFSFSVAIDLSHIPVQEDYIRNPDNYQVKEGNFKITAIEPIIKNNIDPADWGRIQNSDATHVVTLTATQPVYSTTTFALKKQIPQWIYETDATLDQREEAEGKTFGFKYLVEGIAEAYAMISPQKDNYFEVKIPIQQESASYSWILFSILFLLLAGGTAVWYVRRK